MTAFTTVLLSTQVPTWDRAPVCPGAHTVSSCDPCSIFPSPTTPMFAICNVHFLPEFLREKPGCALYMGISIKT